MSAQTSLIGARKSQQLLTAATSTNAAPTLVTDGLAINDNPRSAEGLLVLKSTAGSGVMTVTIRMWGWSDVAAVWFPLGVGSEGSKGTIDAGTSIEEEGANTLQHGELLTGVQHIERLYAQITAIGGAATAVSMWFVSVV